MPTEFINNLQQNKPKAPTQFVRVLNTANYSLEIATQFPENYCYVELLAEGIVPSIAYKDPPFDLMLATDANWKRQLYLGYWNDGCV